MWKIYQRKRVWEVFHKSHWSVFNSSTVKFILKAGSKIPDQWNKKHYMDLKLHTNNTILRRKPYIHYSKIAPNMAPHILLIDIKTYETPPNKWLSTLNVYKSMPKLIPSSLTRSHLQIERKSSFRHFTKHLAFQTQTLKTHVKGGNKCV